MALALESMESVSEGVRMVAREARSMGIFGGWYLVSVWMGKADAYRPNQLSIRGFRLFSLMLTMPISRWAFSGESEACAALTMMVEPNSRRIVPGGAFEGSVGPSTSRIFR